ncbi:MAG TPA: DUF4349 domain-containing protein [Longimicrobium sp.]|nr:DUF4349 domain-containing protein [Longimicrobium sp.]
MKPIHIFILPLLLAACGADTSGGALHRTSTEETVDLAEMAPAADGVAQSSGDPAAHSAPSSRPAVSGMASSQVPDAPPSATPQPNVAPTMLIRTGRATVEVDSLEAAVELTTRMARQLGGYVGNTTLTRGDREARVATLELKVPAARFDQVVGGLRPIGRVESVEVSAEDVGEEFVDVSARTANSRRMEERLLALLATRTGKLEDVLAVERELARVRQEIESTEGRLRFLRTRAAVSTLVVTLHEPRPVVGSYPSENPIAEAFRDAWRNFVGFIAWFIAALGFLIPFSVILVALWWIARRIRRALPRRVRPTPPVPPTPPTPPTPPVPPVPPARSAPIE